MGVIMCKIMLLDIVHCINYKIIELQSYGSWIFLLSSSEKHGDRTQNLTTGLSG
jgi:hypothetical protein